MTTRITRQGILMLPAMTIPATAKMGMALCITLLQDIHRLAMVLTLILVVTVTIAIRTGTSSMGIRISITTNMAMSAMPMQHARS